MERVHLPLSPLGQTSDQALLLLELRSEEKKETRVTCGRRQLRIDPRGLPWSAACCSALPASSPARATARVRVLDHNTMLRARNHEGKRGGGDDVRMEIWLT